MADNIQVRLVNVEFLRPGPPHNQLLSPLTQYLAVCGDAGAGVVTVPYEHATFERKLKELRYETGDPGDRLAMLHDIGVDMGRILGSVPGLPGSSDDRSRSSRTARPSPADAVGVRARAAAFRAREGADRSERHGRELARDPDAAAGVSHPKHPHRVARRRRVAARAAHPVRGRRSRRRPVRRSIGRRCVGAIQPFQYPGRDDACEARPTARASSSASC